MIIAEELSEIRPPTDKIIGLIGMKLSLVKMALFMQLNQEVRHAKLNLINVSFPVDSLNKLCQISLTYDLRMR